MERHVFPRFALCHPGKTQKSYRQIAVGCATLHLRLLLLYRLWSRKVGRKVTLAAFFYAQRRPVTLLRGSESRHQIAHYRVRSQPGRTQSMIASRSSEKSRSSE